MITINENPKEAYDKIVEYFSRPDARLSQSNPNTCFYRHPEDGRACAVGCLISDEDYSESNIEGLSLYSLEQTGEISVPSSITKDFLDRAQDQHDGAISVSQFLTTLTTTYIQDYKKFED